MASANLYHLFYMLFDQQKIYNCLENMEKKPSISSAFVPLRTLGEGSCFVAYEYPHYGYPMDYAVLVEKTGVWVDQPFYRRFFSRRSQWIDALNTLGAHSLSLPLIPPLVAFEYLDKAVLVLPKGLCLRLDLCHDAQQLLRETLIKLRAYGFVMKDKIQIARFENEIFIHDFSDLSPY
ncbi:MAG: hypothetical protein OXT67_04345 [Zetaproteobacteria bacterium]|nr:hypothetical protein [Zetaproteobacteria bacterium]